MKKRKTPAEQLREAILRENAKPAHEQFQAMIDHGSINEKGEVLLKYPKPPRKPRKPKAEKNG